MAKPPGINLSVPYHRQGSAEYCSGACLQMLLEWAGIPDSSWTPSTQSVLRTSVDNWPIPTTFGFGFPLGVALTFNRYRPSDGGFPDGVRLETTPLPYEACGTMVDALFEHKNPSIALVLRGSHYVVVTGAETDVDPRSNRDYSLIALWIHDPEPTLRGTSEHITFGAWLYMQFNGSTDFFPNPFVCVVDARARTRIPRLPPPEKPSSTFGNANEIITDPKLLIQGAKLALQQHGLAEAIKNVDAHNPGDVMFASSLRGDTGETAWYVVPFFNANSPTQTLVMLDAFTGAYLGARFGVPTANYVYSADAALSLAEFAFQDERLSRAQSRSLSFDVRPQLMWRPCLESTSPYNGFYRITVAGPSYKYVRVDGRVFDRLTPR